MTIPASQIVSVTPGVISAGGNPLSFNGVFLTKNPLLPQGAVQSLVSADEVAARFGYDSDEYRLSLIYFAGFDNSTVKPGAMLFAPYADTPQPAWTRGSSLKTMTISQLQTFSGILSVMVDGTLYAATVDLSTATSFSSGATLIQTAFAGAGPVCSWDPVTSAYTLTSQTTGTDSTIEYVTGTLADGLGLSQAKGAILSQGIVAATPSTAIQGVKGVTQNWVTFTTCWEPSLDDKIAFADWSNTANERYLYVGWDTDGQATVSGAMTPFGAYLQANEYDGAIALYNTVELAAFFMGMTASIDFSRLNGRITAAFKSQSGFIPTVTDEQTAANLLANGYSFYGSYSTAADRFNFFYNGQLPGEWKWADTYLNQIWMNSQFQLALIELLTQVKSIPYDDNGYALIRAAMMDPILAAINFGAIRAGVQLSQAQIAEVAQAAGRDISMELNTTGYYLQILDPGAQIRGQRGTPVINFWYMDGGAVQKINVASIAIL